MPAETPAAAADFQQQVDRYFQQSARYWKEIYRDTRLLPVIYRARRAAVEHWVDVLRLPRGSRVLEIGCGAGLLATTLAQRGLRVTAMDSAPAMVEQTRQLTASAGVAHRVTVSSGDAHCLKYPADSFDLVIAVGVIPWLHSEAAAVCEMTRVLKPGGSLIVTADNAARLNRLLDPRSTPALAPLRLAIKRLFRAARPAGLVVKKHYPWQVDRLVRAAGLEKIESRTIGFGPFSLFDRKLLPEAAAVKLHRRLQSLADARIPIFRATGSHYLVLASKPQSV